jgi:Zn-dependent oligopeptidase
MSDNAGNPLVDLGHDIPFDRIGAEHVEPAVDLLIERAKAGHDAIAEVGAPVT